MKHKILNFIILLIGSFSCFSQKETSNIMLSYSENQDIYIYEYMPNFKIKAEYKSQSQAINKYPEQLLQSILSATNQEWVNYNTLGGIDKADIKDESHFTAIKKMDKEKNYFELIHKITFDIDNIQTSIIKFFLHEGVTEPISGVVVMQKVNDRWFTTSNINLSTLSIMVMRLKTEVLRGVILGNSENLDIKNLHKKVNTDGGINLTVFENEFLSWYDSTNDANKKLFLDSKTW